ncbi:chondroadherin-like isoform X2 [Mizuhopecten yessoensis]|uniref:chondroadherin-like isoform X2 n=1 Tax=Mizuhopecten yessoensis TaxID=6573 RepID=UPI000B459BC4|nr:chondroadherin-like isoform X2 [Mizuhopecten yessoensis]
MDMDGIYVYIIMLLLTNGIQGTSLPVPEDPSPCPVRAPCSCNFNKVFCNNLTQTEIPTFTKVNATWKCWELNMNYNYNIKTIPSGAFDNIPFCSLQIGHNGFETIKDGALAGSEPYLDSVFMQYNNFKDLPNEIARMPNITMLSIHDNPINSLPQTMAFASTLEFLDIGSSAMTTWPNSIGTLKSVSSLTIYKLTMSDLPVNAFEGLEDSIQLLWFTATKFKGIPKALRRLRKVTDLAFEDNVELTSEGITDDAFIGMDSLRDIDIKNSSLSRVPNLSKIPAISSLSLTNSPIASWDSNTLPEQPIIQSVSLTNTDLDHIPAVVRRIRSIFQLTLQNTKVSHIGPGDLAGLQKLQYLSLSQTPLVSISMDAFNDTSSLQGLYLDNTKLSGFPRAIERLPALRFVSLQNVTIECSCAELGWMKTWIGIKQFLGGDGQCHNIRMEFIEYVHNEVPKCP